MSFSESQVGSQREWVCDRMSQAVTIACLNGHVLQVQTFPGETVKEIAGRVADLLSLPMDQSVVLSCNGKQLKKGDCIFGIEVPVLDAVIVLSSRILCNSYDYSLCILTRAIIGTLSQIYSACFLCFGSI